MNKTSRIISQVRDEGRKLLLEPEAKAICLEYGIPVTEFKLAKNPEETVIFAEQIGFPVVLKIVSADIVHKSDAGGVVLDLKNEAEVLSAHHKIIENAKKYSPTAKVIGVLVQEMAPQSTEIIVGAIKDTQFGQTVMFGLGWIFVELLDDVAFRIAPLKQEDAEEMITRVRAYPLLRGYRNTPPADIPAIVNVLLNASKLVMDYPDIKELDLNPIMTYDNGLKTVDARIILE